MSIWAKVGEFLAGGASAPMTTITTAATAAADIVERWAPSAEKKQEMTEAVHAAINNAVEQAREADKQSSTGTWFDSFANGLNRLVRPLVTFSMLLGLYGVLPLPTTGTVEPIVLYWIGGLFTYWFGTRTLFKDIPEALAYLRNTRGNK